MPLIRIDDLGDGVRMGLWQMTEPIDALPVPPGVDLADVRTEKRRREVLTSYSLLKALTGADLLIRHAPNGSPLVDGLSISLSHTLGWAAMVVADSSKRLGIDIEYYSDRVNKIADRFIRADEQSSSLAYRLVNWSMKETVYKALTEEDLIYSEMRLTHYDVGKSGKVAVEDLKCGRHVEAEYILNADYVLTWAVMER